MHKYNHCSQCSGHTTKRNETKLSTVGYNLKSNSSIEHKLISFSADLHHKHFNRVRLVGNKICVYIFVLLSGMWRSTCEST